VKVSCRRSQVNEAARRRFNGTERPPRDNEFHYQPQDVNPHIGKLVRSIDNDLGVGKIVDSNPQFATIEYFDSPVSVRPHIQQVPMASVRAKPLLPQTRVYFFDVAAGYWRIGRVHGQVEDTVFIDLPNQQTAQRPVRDVYVRWNCPLPDPWEHLAARLTETAYFHMARVRLIGHLTRQRALSMGMTGLLSAPISLERHQVEVIRRVLQDPVQRYLLADEVGLGKTVEAGVILRQHILDNPNHHVLVIVPSSLVEQWSVELKIRCQVGNEFGHRVEIISFDALADWLGATPDLIIVDEAHQGVTGWNEPASSPLRARFEKLRSLSRPLVCPKLLLLSATPVRGNEQGFLALLHLLDPAVYPLEGLDAFQLRVARRQQLADLFVAFTEDQEPFFLETMIGQLAELFPVDVRLNVMLNKLKDDLSCETAFDEARRRAAIRGVRLHLSETYRLHRRLLRNRRSNEVAELLPGRTDLTKVPCGGVGISKAERLLDAWRSSAAAAVWGDEQSASAKGLEFIFHVLLEAAWSDAKAFSACLEARKTGRLPEGVNPDDPLLDRKRLQALTETPKFAGEVDILAELSCLRATLEATQAERIQAIRSLAQGLRSKGYRIVCMCTSPTAADELFACLSTKWPPDVARHQPGDTGWREAWTNETASILVCDIRAEEGVNLQGGKACLIHFDLPLSPNRIEQRMGRLDRFGVGIAVPSFSLQLENAAFWSAWLDCVDSAWQVFSRSIASLQYVVEDELVALRSAMFFEGVDALESATQRLMGSEGRIEKEFRVIRNQDELDSLEVSFGSQGVDLIAQLDKSDSEATEFQKAVDAWLIERLQFVRVGENGPGDSVVRYHYRSSESGKQTLIAKDDFVKWFGSAIDPHCRHREFRWRPLTQALTFGRETARRRQVGLGRIGTPLLDGVYEYLRWDDRGTCFAIWRHTPRISAGQVHACFRFDFIVESALSPLSDWLKERPHLNASAVRRKADAAFPPIAETIWIDNQLLPLTDDCIEDLNRPLDAKLDKNVNQERWPVVLKQFGSTMWAELCADARRVAEESLRLQHDLTNSTRRLASEFEAIGALVQEQGRSRMEALVGWSEEQSQLRDEVEEAEHIASQIAAGIRAPHIRLDAAGVVFRAGDSLT
jgi:ATP-dependent helicase HepA